MSLLCEPGRHAALPASVIPKPQSGRSLQHPMVALTVGLQRVARPPPLALASGRAIERTTTRQTSNSQPSILRNGSEVRGLEVGSWRLGVDRGFFGDLIAWPL